MIRKQLYWMMGLVMVLTSCQKEETTSPDETIFQTITVSIPQEVGTRGSTGDGSLINRCILQVYRNEQPVGERQTVAITGSTITFNVSLRPTISYSGQTAQPVTRMDSRISFTTQGIWKPSH